MLPAQCHVGIAGRDPGALPLRIVKVFGAQGEVVQLVRRIVDVDEKGLLVRRAGQHSGIAALRRVRGVERSELRAERRAAIGNESGDCRIVEVRHIALVNIPVSKAICQSSLNL